MIDQFTYRKTSYRVPVVILKVGFVLRLLDIKNSKIKNLSLRLHAMNIVIRLVQRYISLKIIKVLQILRIICSGFYGKWQIIK